MKNKLSMIISMVIFGTIGIFVEFIGLPSGFIASFRGLVGAVLIMCAAFFSEISFSKKKKVRTDNE